ncbi:MAG: hypothetical protein OXL36_00450 [Bryobacterales bacterium]|nr:hypothetical protein [Bryobacterales bacterium]MDE0294390.1 hypothetical protein [Bryobacterales bacterium]
MPRLPVVKSETRLAFERSGFVSILFAIVRPRDAKAAAVNEKTLTLTFPGADATAGVATH